MELLKLEVVSPYLDELVELLCDAVDSGASIGFLPPLSHEEAKCYWENVNEGIQGRSRILLAIREDNQLVGAVQIALSPKANALHRADVEKLIVHSQYRGRGFGKHLMQGVEKVAGSLQRHLLVLDTRHGDTAYHLYLKLGYVECGSIPGYARSASGELDATTFFYKEVDVHNELI